MTHFSPKAHFLWTFVVRAGMGHLLRGAFFSTSLNLHFDTALQGLCGVPRLLCAHVWTIFRSVKSRSFWLADRQRGFRLGPSADDSHRIHRRHKNRTRRSGHSWMFIFVFLVMQGSWHPIITLNTPEESRRILTSETEWTFNMKP